METISVTRASSSSDLNDTIRLGHRSRGNVRRRQEAMRPERKKMTHKDLCYFKWSRENLSEPRLYQYPPGLCRIAIYGDYEGEVLDDRITMVATSTLKRVTGNVTYVVLPEIDKLPMTILLEGLEKHPETVVIANWYAELNRLPEGTPVLLAARVETWPKHDHCDCSCYHLNMETIKAEIPLVIGVSSGTWMMDIATRFWNCTDVLNVGVKLSDPEYRKYRTNFEIAH
jgi:hypothetical protein